MSKKTTLILELKKIQRVVRNTPVLDIRHLKFHKGTVYGIVGPVGSGKSSLLNILSGSSKPNSGSILYDYNPFKKSFFGSTLIPKDVTHVNIDKASFLENFTEKNSNTAVRSLFKKSNATQVLSKYLSNLSTDKIVKANLSTLTRGERSAVELSTGIESDPRVHSKIQETVISHEVRISKSTIKNIQKQISLLLLCGDTYDLSTSCPPVSSWIARCSGQLGWH